MKKIKKISLYLVITLLILPYATVLMINNITLINTAVSIDAGYFGNSSYTIVMPEKYVSGTELRNVFKANSYKDFAIYSNYISQEEIKGVYFEKEFINMPMLEGRFFLPSDFAKENYCAVVGKNHKKDIVQINNDKYIYIGSVKLKVLGIMGLEGDSLIDNQIYINMLNEIPTIEGINFFTLDYFGGNGETFIADATNLLSSKLGTEINMISASQSTLSRMIPKIISARWFVAILVCDILCISLLSLEWKNQHMHEYCIKRLVGFKDRKIFKDILIKYGLICMTCAVISSIIINIWFVQYAKYILIGLVATFVYLILFSVFITRSIIKMPLAEAIK